MSSFSLICSDEIDKFHEGLYCSLISMGITVAEESTKNPSPFSDRNLKNNYQINFRKTTKDISL